MLYFYYAESVRALNINSFIASSENLIVQWWDPENPIVLIEKLNQTQIDIDLETKVPPMTTGLYLTLKQRGENLPSIKANFQSSVDEINIDSFLSQINPVLLRLAENEKKISVEVFENAKEADIFIRGIMYLR